LLARCGTNGIIHATNCNMMNMPLPADRVTRWIFLSPHLDDAVFSCGGLISYLSDNGVSVEIWTVFSDQMEDARQLTDYARTLHNRWGTGDHPYVLRKQEDANACRTVGARQHHLGYLDCIYRFIPGSREPVVLSDAELQGTVKPQEQPFIEKIARDLKTRITELTVWVCPLSLGSHVDHQITRKAAEMTGKLMLYYADLPYALPMPRQSISGMIQLSIDVPEKNIQDWGRANLQYSSQISSFWKSPADMADQYSAFLQLYKGMPLWLPNPGGEGGK